MPTAREVVTLYRTFLREGKKFPNYNIREYILRRSKEDFHLNAGQHDATTVQALWSKALEDLEVVKRQSIVYKLYGRKMLNVMVSQPPVDRAQLHVTRRWPTSESPEGIILGPC
jgi:LYR motif-containing protein 4